MESLNTDPNVHVIFKNLHQIFRFTVHKTSRTREIKGVMFIDEVIGNSLKTCKRMATEQPKISERAIWIKNKLLPSHKPATATE